MARSDMSGKEAFSTTNWSLVLEAQGDAPDRAREALAALCEIYWPPLYAFARGRGHGAEEARDLTQALFVQLLERRAFHRVQPDAGRLRSFLVASMRNLLTDEHARSNALKRGAVRQPVRIDTGAALVKLADPMTPEAAFEKQWALTVLRRSLGRVREEFARKGEAARFELLKPFLIGDAPARPYRQVAEELGVAEDAVKMAVHRLRRRFGRALRETVTETVARHDEVDKEIRHLLKVLRG